MYTVAWKEEEEEGEEGKRLKGGRVLETIE